MKFATKLTLLFSGIFLVLCIFITHIATSFSSGILESTIENQMEARAVGRMDKIDKVIFERLMDMKMMASEPLFKSNNPSPVSIAERLEELSRNSGSYTSLSFFDMSRKRVVDTAGDEVGRVHSLSEYWPDIESGKEFVIGMYSSESLRTPVFHIAVVVKNSAGARRGVLVARMTHEWLSEVLKFPAVIQPFDKVLNEENLLKMDLVDNKGLIIYSNYSRNSVLKETSKYWEYIKDEVGRKTPYKGYRLRLPGMEEEIVTFGREKGFKDYKGNGWTMIVHVPSRIVFGPSIDLRNRLITFMAAIGGFGLLVILFFSRTVSRPIMKLSAAAAEFGRGNMDVKVETGSKDELGALAESLNLMVKNLSASRLALVRSEESHRELFENARDFVYTTDLNAAFTSVNRALCQRCGYRAEELVGAPISTIVHPGSLEKARGMTEAKLKGETTHTRYEMEIVAKNGEIIPVELISRLIIVDGKPAGVQGIGRDIGERKAAEEKLRRSEEWFRALIENQNDMIIVIDGNNDLKYFSPSTQRITGYTPGETAKAGLEYVHPGDVEAVRNATLKAAQNPGVPFPLELRLRHKNGNWLTFASLGTSYLGNPAIGGIIINYHNITERKEAEEKLKAAKEEAEAATLLKDKFVALVSHDLKGPLGIMMGFLKLLHKDMETAHTGERLILESAINSGETMIALINDILNISRIRSGKIAPRPVFADACFLSVKAISLLKAQAAVKGITLTNRVPDKTRIYADPELAGQVLQNLISNAIKFSDKGGEVNIFQPEGEPGTIAVSDTGVGIRPGRIATLFKYEETKSTIGTAGEAGSGFGLPLSNEIVLAHGGSLTVESAPGKGSTFFIRLPFVRPRLLIVDDDVLPREVIKTSLLGHDFEFVEAGNGKEALDAIHNSSFHLVMLDLNMPVMDGFALLEKLKGAPETKRLPVIIVTADFDPVSQERAMALGADDFITKGMAQNEIFLRVARALSRPLN